MHRQQRESERGRKKNSSPKKHHSLCSDNALNTVTQGQAYIAARADGYILYLSIYIFWHYAIILSGRKGTNNIYYVYMKCYWMFLYIQIKLSFISFHCALLLYHGYTNAIIGHWCIETWVNTHSNPIFMSIFIIPVSVIFIIFPSW